MSPKRRVHKILLAEPETGLLALLTQHLTAAGYAVVTAADGPEALERERSERPDLVCMAVDLPHLDGLEVCKTIKAARAVPVLLSTSHLDDRISAGLVTSGAEDLLFKPYEVDEVIDKVAWFLEQA